MAAKRNITFKLLFNDAVAMTGGQALAGGLTAVQMAQQVLAEGIEHCALVTDAPEKYRNSAVPAWSCGIPPPRLDEGSEGAGCDSRRFGAGLRSNLRLRETPAEKTRIASRSSGSNLHQSIRLRGMRRCGVKSNCVAVLPLETELGRKRQIDQSSCNKDFSCVEGFCPSFVTLNGATPRKMTRAKYPILGAMSRFGPSCPSPHCRTWAEGPIP